MNPTPIISTGEALGATWIATQSPGILHLSVTLEYPPELALSAFYEFLINLNYRADLALALSEQIGGQHG